MATTTIVENSSKATYSFEEVQKHSTRESAWFVIDNSVYDVTKFAKAHPGGNILFTRAGGDATDAYHAFHGQHGDAVKKIHHYKIGELKEPIKVPAYLKEYRQLLAQMNQQGLFEVNFLTAFIYFAIWMGFLAAGFVALTVLPFSWPTIIFSGILVGISWGQAGFTMHDLGHHSYFKTPTANNLANMFVFNFCLGGAESWWRGRHNRHHAVPNHVDVDLDIRTLPLFAWDEMEVAKYLGKFKQLRYQYLYWMFFGPPVLFIAYRVLTFYWVLKRKIPLELLCNAIHWAVKLTILVPIFGWGLHYYFVWEIIALIVSGGYLGWVFSLNHYMYPLVRGPVNDWVIGTTTTTQNIYPSTFVDWLTGHLDYQVEHHLFPRMPRFNLPKAHTMLSSLLKKHSIDLHEEHLLVSIGQVFGQLRKAAIGGSKMAESRSS